MLFTLFIFFLLIITFILPQTTITYGAARYVESVFGLPPTEMEMLIEDQEKEELESESESESDWVKESSSESGSESESDLLHDSMIQEKDNSVKVDEKDALSGSTSAIDGLVEEITETVTEKIIEALEDKLKTN